MPKHHVAGGPELGGGTVAARAAVLGAHHAGFLRTVVNEPRGSEVLVGALALALREAVRAAGHPAVDHVELFGPPRCGGDARNFVLCPGGAYDRSPCGTGTSAKLACLAADGDLQPGETWVQESVIGSTFSARYAWQDEVAGVIVPVITGTAHLCGEGALLVEKGDPFREGIAVRG